MDIEGWEYTIISNYGLNFLKESASLIIEVHEELNEGYSHGVPEIDPGKLRNMLKEIGYQIEEFKNHNRQQSFLYCYPR